MRPADETGYSAQQLSQDPRFPKNIVDPQPVPKAQEPTLDYQPLYFGDMVPYGYSAVDLTAWIHPREGSGLAAAIQFGTLAMLSTSTHRDKFPVSALSRVAPRGFTYGHRTIAGTLAFNTIDSDAFRPLVEGTRYTWKANKLHPDELPPFDIQLVFANEMGEVAVASLVGVTILDSGSTYSLDNVALSETYSYMALDRTPLRTLRYASGFPTSRPSEITDTMAANPSQPAGGGPVQIGRARMVEGYVWPT